MKKYLVWLGLGLAICVQPTSVWAGDEIDETIRNAIRNAKIKVTVTGEISCIAEDVQDPYVYSYERFTEKMPYSVASRILEQEDSFLNRLDSKRAAAKKEAMGSALKKCEDRARANWKTPCYCNWELVYLPGYATEKRWHLEITRRNGSASRLEANKSSESECLSARDARYECQLAGAGPLCAEAREGCTSTEQVKTGRHF